MINIGLATSAEFPMLGPNEIKLIPLLKEAGIEAKPFVWNSAGPDHLKFDFIIIRSCWDYHTNSEAFIHWIKWLQSNEVKVLNPTHVILDNIDKLYLRDLAQLGVEIVPTSWIEQPSESLIKNQMTTYKWEEAVLKPTVSASAFETYRFGINDDLGFLNQMTSQHFMLQPFIDEITDPGEYSLIFFNKQFSHAVLKTPGKNDFRVQQELGGSTKPIAVEKQYINQAQSILSHLPDPLLLARVDGIIRNNQFVLMELELIEPELYLYNDENLNSFSSAIINITNNF